MTTITMSPKTEAAAKRANELGGISRKDLRDLQTDGVSADELKRVDTRLADAEAAYANALARGTKQHTRENSVLASMSVGEIKEMRDSTRDLRALLNGERSSDARAALRTMAGEPR
jgi:hypothetical protein